MSGTLPWYAARASGLIAWALLAGSVVWGLLMSSKLMRRQVKSSWLLDLHRWLGGLALIFTGIHVAAILADTYVHFGVASVLIPLAASWHPVAVAWGIASLYLLAAVEVTSLVRRHLSHRLWRKVHFLSFPLFVASTLHGVSAGTDGRKPMVIIAAVLTAAAVGALTIVRARRSGSSSLLRPVGPVGPVVPRPHAPVGPVGPRPVGSDGSIGSVGVRGTGRRAAGAIPTAERPDVFVG